MTEATPRKRGRAGAKDRHRRRKLYPLCSACLAQGLVTLTKYIDHIVPLKDGGPDTDENCQGLCSECHVKKTGKDMGYKEVATFGLDGWPI